MPMVMRLTPTASSKLGARKGYGAHFEWQENPAENMRQAKDNAYVEVLEEITVQKMLNEPTISRSSWTLPNWETE